MIFTFFRKHVKNYFTLYSMENLLSILMRVNMVPSKCRAHIILLFLSFDSDQGFKLKWSIETKMFAEKKT